MGFDKCWAWLLQASLKSARSCEKIAGTTHDLNSIINSGKSCASLSRRSIWSSVYFTPSMVTTFDCFIDPKSTSISGRSHDGYPFIFGPTHCWLRRRCGLCVPTWWSHCLCDHWHGWPSPLLSMVSPSSTRTANLDAILVMSARSRSLRCGLVQKVLGGLSLESQTVFCWALPAFCKSHKTVLVANMVCACSCGSAMTAVVGLRLKLLELPFACLRRCCGSCTMHVWNLLNLKNTAVSVTWLVFSALWAVPKNLPRLLVRLIFPPLTCDLRSFPSSGDLFERRIAISSTMDFLMISGGSTSTALASNVRFTNTNFFTKLRPSTLWELLLLDLRLTTLRYHAKQLWIMFVLWARM